MTKRYSIGELLAAAKCMASVPEPAGPASLTVPQSDNYRPTYDASFESIRSGCAAVNALQASAKLTYDEWLTFLSIASRCKGAEEIAHRVSRQDPRYDHQETQKKFEEARDRMKPRTCAYIEISLGSEACRNCAVRSTVHSPMAFGSADPNIAALQAQWIIDAETQRFISLHTGEAKTDAAFRTRFNHLADKAAVTSMLINDGRTGKVDRTVYRPGCADLVIQEEAGRLLNIWRPGGVEPKEGGWSTLHAHFEKLIPNPEEFIHFLNYIANLLQSPGTKLGHVILIIGKQGIGKSVISTLVRKLVGDRNVKELGPDQADTRFRAGWGDCQVCFMEELMMGERLEFYNCLKPWVTQETCAAEEKHIAARHVATPRGFIMFSNHVNATLLPPDDRRFCVIHSSMERQDEGYYDRLWRAVEEEASAFKHYLLSHDLSGFNPSAPAPLTKAKQEMIEDSRPPLEAELIAMLEAEVFPMNRDLVRLEEVISVIRSRIPNPVRRNVLVAAMKACEFVQRSVQTPLEGGAKPRLWIVRNHTRWLNCTAEEIRAEMRSPPKFASGRI